MSDFPKEVLMAIGVVLTAVLGFFGVKIKNRSDDAKISRDLRDELREENRLKKEENRLLKEENRLQAEEIGLLKELISAHEAKERQWSLERLQLRQEIADLRARFDDFSDVEPL